MMDEPKSYQGSISLGLATEHLRVFMQWQRAALDETMMVSPETDPHVTLLRGVESDVDIDAVRGALRGLGGLVVTTKKFAIFKDVREDVDAVVVLVHSKELMSMRSRLEDALDPDRSEYAFRPHITLGYVYAGTHDFLDEVPVTELNLWADELRVRRDGETEPEVFTLNSEEAEDDD